MLKIQYKDFNKDSGFNTNTKCFLLCIDVTAWPSWVCKQDACYTIAWLTIKTCRTFCSIKQINLEESSSRKASYASNL